MAEQEDTDRSTAAPWVPIGAPGYIPAPGPVEDYESLGSTFLGGGGAHTVVMGEVVEEPEPEVYPVEWNRLFLLALGLVAIGACVLIGVWLSHLVGAVHLPSFHAGSTGGHFSPDAGRMFAALILPFGVIVFFLWLVKGR